jgi:hypothetical protein
MTFIKNASGKGLKPAHADLEKLVVEYSVLCTRTNPPGEPIPILVTPFNLDDEIPKEGDIEDIVERLKLGKAPGPSGIKSEQLKMWLDASKRSNDPYPVKWNKFVELVHHALATGGFPAENSWSVLVVIPKCCSIIDSRLKAVIEFDDSLHGFRA